MGAVDLHQSDLGSALHARSLLADLLGGGQHPHPAAAMKSFAACLKGLQAAVLVAFVFVVQPPAVGSIPSAQT
jgi:hypothetical protein